MSIKNLAIIKNGRISNIILFDTEGEWVPPNEYIDVTDTKYAIGWIDNEDGTFSEPIPDPIPIPPTHETTISLPEFLMLFDKHDNRLIKAETNSNETIEHFWDVVHASQEINLTDQWVIDGIAELVLGIPQFDLAWANDILKGKLLT